MLLHLQFPPPRANVRFLILRSPSPHPAVLQSHSPPKSLPPHTSYIFVLFYRLFPHQGPVAEHRTYTPAFSRPGFIPSFRKPCNVGFDLRVSPRKPPLLPIPPPKMPPPLLTPYSFPKIPPPSLLTPHFPPFFPAPSLSRHSFSLFPFA